MAFSPFDKTINEQLNESDLRQLITRGVAEGLYVEYKREFPANKKIGHSIAAFANSYGGWYFVGIEADKVNNLPVNIEGFSLKDVHDPISTLRDVVKSHINPVPAFTSKLVTLASGNIVLVVYVPGEQDKPFISADGRIYRRRADSSDPISENDRHTVDRLYSEGRRNQKRFVEFCEEEPPLGNNEHIGWLKLFIAPYPDLIEKFDFLDNDGVERLLLRSRDLLEIPYYDNSIMAGIPFDAGYSTYKSVILRQMADNPLSVSFLSVEFFYNGWAKFTIPIPFFHEFKWNNIGTLSSEITKEALREIIKKNRHRLETLQSLRLMDIGKLTFVMACAVSFYLDWLGEQPNIAEYRFRAKLSDVRSVIPFFDGDRWGEHVKKIGLPIITQNAIEIRPHSKDWHNWSRPPLNLPFWQYIALLISYSLGLPESLHAYALAAAARQVSTPNSLSPTEQQNNVS